MRVLVDTNIMLDALLEREPFLREARALIEAIDAAQIEGYTTATTLTKRPNPSRLGLRTYIHFRVQQLYVWDLTQNIQKLWISLKPILVGQDFVA